MLSVVHLLLCVGAVNAYPSLLQARDYAQPGCTVSKACNAYLPISNAQAHIPATPNAATKLSASRTNCGILGVCNTFNAEQQYVSTSGTNAFIKPSATDIRGPCPGLNAAANHGYLNRNGLQDIESTTIGLFNAYGFAPDFAAFLAVFSAAVAGDLETLTWSIGGPLPSTILTGVTGTPGGISYSHNLYEGDTSISRCDAYTNGGDAHSSSVTRFGYAYASGMSDDSYTLDKFSQLYAKNTHRSILQNANYFAPLVSTTVVSPAAYNFVINFMSNHSAAVPGGYLDGSTFKSFFAMSGNYPNFYWEKGLERIPDNWYRRPNENPYGASGLVADLIPEFAAYPDSFRFGGNVGGKNTYTGIDIANVTNGAYNADTILQGDNLGCFILVNFQQAIPLELQGGVNNVAAVTAALNKFLPSYFKNLQCPQLTKYDTSVFQQYSGYNYRPSAPLAGGAQNC